MAALSSPDGTDGPAVVRVMTYNLKGLRLDPHAAAEVVRSADPDVLGVQEPPRGPFGRRRLRRFAHLAGLRVAVGGHGARTTALLVAPRTGAVGDPRAVRLPWFGRRAGRVWPTRRGYAVATVCGVRVVVVHLSLDPLERARHLTRVLAEIGRAPGPCVLVGDLNEQPGGDSWLRLGELLDDAHVAPAHTFSAARPRRRIDAVLASRDLVPRRAHVPDDVVARRASDHLPVVAELGVPR